MSDPAYGVRPIYTTASVIGNDVGQDLSRFAAPCSACPSRRR